MEYQRKRCFLLNTKQQYVLTWQILNSMFPIESQNYVFIWQTLNNMFPIEKQKIMFPLGILEILSNRKIMFSPENNQKTLCFQS